jgi:hypothetical protein
MGYNGPEKMTSNLDCNVNNLWEVRILISPLFHLVFVAPVLLQALFHKEAKEAHKKSYRFLFETSVRRNKQTKYNTDAFTLRSKILLRHCDMIVFLLLLT